MAAAMDTVTIPRAECDRRGDWRGLTQAALARRSGVNGVRIAGIEAGRKTRSVATLRALADALDDLG